mmetsp:Transcript_28581/g.32826  ORF Transcript_28581/g.32826 Transcript_28581/m.32826 type:complete len:204 (-) Transcript_28581:149-760(-)
MSSSSTKLFNSVFEEYSISTLGLTFSFDAVPRNESKMEKGFETFVSSLSSTCDCDSDWKVFSSVAVPDEVEDEGVVTESLTFIDSMASSANLIAAMASCSASDFFKSSFSVASGLSSSFSLFPAPLVMPLNQELNMFSVYNSASLTCCPVISTAFSSKLGGLAVRLGSLMADSESSLDLRFSRILCSACIACCRAISAASSSS